MKLPLVLAIAASAALCQQAQIAGLVQDPAGLSVRDAKISVRSEQTGGRRQTSTNESGFYSVASLNPGTYRILISHDGFETIVREGVTLAVGDNARLDFTLRIGDSRTEITVTGGPPLINTEDASIGTVIDRNTIDKMPLNGRGVQSLIELAPGVEAVPVITSNSGQFSVNGQRSVSNYFTVDGVSANFGAGVISTVLGGNLNLSQAGGAVLPANNLMGTFSNLVSPDALQEFKIQTSTFAPEFGRAPGAHVGFLTRSGTNRYAGSLFEYFRNDVVDANDWFSNRQGLPRSPLRFNNFGGTVGGPLRGPRLSRGDARTFFFFSFEDLVMRQPQPPILLAVPTAQARLSEPSSAALLYDALPLPNLPYSVGTTASGWAGFGFGLSLPTSQQTWSLRLDHYFSGKLIGFARYNQAPSHQQRQGPTNSLTPIRFSAGTGTLTAGVTQTVGPALVNDLRANFSWQDVSSTSQFLTLNGAKLFPESLLFPPGYSSRDSYLTFFDASDPAIPIVQVGMFAAGRSRQVQVVDQLSYTRGTHQFKFGFDYRLFTIFSKTPRTASSYYSSNLPDGQISSLTEAVSHADVAWRAQALSFYAQDTWHIFRHLTATYGLRWEVEPAPRPTSGDVSVYNPLPGGLELSALSPAPPGAPYYPTRYTSLAPRIGIAWQMLDQGNWKALVRAGTGVFYDSAQSEFEVAGASPLNYYSYFNFPLGRFPSGALPSYGSGPQFAPAVAEGYTLPRTYEWNVTLEQSFGHQTFSAAYVGALGRRLLGTVRGPRVLPPKTILPIGLQITANYFSSSYNALQLQFNRRMSKRVQATISWTWSHSIDNRSDQAGTSLSPGGLTSLLDPDENRGDSDFDVRQSLHGSVFIRLPAPGSGPGAVMLRNWTASTIFFARTALPTNLVTITHSGTELRPDVVAGQPLYLYNAAYPGGKGFNAAAFTEPANGAKQGDLGRNALRGFGAWQADFALHRQFQLSEHTTMQVRGEAFNVFNHPNFANPTSGNPPQELILVGVPGLSMSSLAAGLSPIGTLGQLHQLFQIGSPRSLQLALRFSF